MASASVAALGSGALVSAVPAIASEASSKNDEENVSGSDFVPGTPKETIDTDIVVVGLGMSGLAAAVQAALNGDSVVGIDAAPDTGGNGVGVEGIFASGSSLQQEQGIEFDPVEVLSSELSAFQMRSDGALWLSFINSSADNVDWLIEQGVKFSGVVDDYYGACVVPCFHWFDGNVASVGYIPPMTERAKELGVDIRLETRGRSLIMENGKVAGIYAENSDGDVVQINAKAVILACGGYAQNEGYMKERGWNWDNIVYGGVGYHLGDGLDMAFAVGARSFVKDSTFNCTNICGRGDTFAWKADTFTSVFCGAGMFGSKADQLYVNQDGKRFINEDFAAGNFEMQSVPALTHRAMYSVFDRAILEADCADDPDTVDRVDAADEPDLVCADTLEEAAQQAGIDPDALVASVERYNECCEAGKDLDFGKDSSMLTPIQQSPFYIAKLNQYFLMSVGGIECDANARVLDDDKLPISGLYAVGTDGCMLYRNIYTINVGGTCNGNNVNSGRVAANHAHGYIAG